MTPTCRRSSASSVASLRRRFGKVLTKLRAERRTQINKMVWESAKGGNATLLTWLGKVELGWSDEKNEPLVAPPTRKKPFDFHAFALEFERLFGTPSDKPDEEKS